jgi:hypothetical protein
MELHHVSNPSTTVVVARPLSRQALMVAPADLVDEVGAIVTELRDLNRRVAFIRLRTDAPASAYFFNRPHSRRAARRGCDTNEDPLSRLSGRVRAGLAGTQTYRAASTIRAGRRRGHHVSREPRHGFRVTVTSCARTGRQTFVLLPAACRGRRADPPAARTSTSRSRRDSRCRAAR